MVEYKKVNLVHILLSAVGIFLLLLAVLFLIISYTGHIPRSYSVLGPGDQVEVAGKRHTPDEIAALYQPKVYLRPETPTPPLEWVWYEIIPAQDAVHIVYYHAWKNEINPNPFIHWLYSVFRAAYWGYPLFDIEYFQVSVSPRDGTVTGLLFETSPGDDYYPVVSEHLIARYTRLPEGAYDSRTVKQSGEIVANARGAPVLFDGSRVLVLAQTWNHLSRLVSASDSGLQWVDAPLRYLTDQDYARYKFVRKSHGDFKTIEGAIWQPN